MTIAPHRAPLTFGNLEEVAAAIRDRGGRLSTARRLILEALFAAAGPVSAEHIAAGLNGKGRRLDPSSVYRNLQLLEELGVVHHVHVAHGPGLYVLEGASKREYLVCERCDRVDTVDADQLDLVRREILAQVGYAARFSHFPIVGLCAVCAAEEEDRGPETIRGDVPHSHPHAHDGHTHAHPHVAHEHKHTEHEHQHTHGDYAHSHPHAHERGLEHLHAHAH